MKPRWHFFKVFNTFEWYRTCYIEEAGWSRWHEDKRIELTFARQRGAFALPMVVSWYRNHRESYSNTSAFMICLLCLNIKLTITEYPRTDVEVIHG